MRKNEKIKKWKLCPEEKFSHRLAGDQTEPYIAECRIRGLERGRIRIQNNTINCVAIRKKVKKVKNNFTFVKQFEQI